ncbi:TlpA family protein disulfide reductase [Paenibacillus sp. F411]|uniref:TlpA disulfide reductase family protein n=1 Tax=Paenibacillus sp. F411 TaxID=2820239 RepID=UPI001AAF7A84|nr:TlpA disulfide reductase family protein [Paenibacillus sp. F411]MBO2942587.1 TlpA family protein disulfide reductase [Paenibacillus sp. F411]
MKRNIIILLVILAAAATVIYKQAGDEIQSVFKTEQPLPVEVGAKAGMLSPTFTLEGMNGGSYSGGGVREKALLINFWASWCEPCRQETPELIELARQYSEELDIYGINVTKYDVEKRARAFADEFNIPYPLLMDEEAEVFEALFKGQAFPTSVLIDRNGVIQEVLVGLPEPAELRKKVKRLTSL